VVRAMSYAPWVHEDDVWRAAFSREGERIVTGSGDKTARLWIPSPASKSASRSRAIAPRP
jgi:WD40 repeat protein